MIYRVVLIFSVFALLLILPLQPSNARFSIAGPSTTLAFAPETPLTPTPTPDALKASPETAPKASSKADTKKKTEGKRDQPQTKPLPKKQPSEQSTPAQPLNHADHPKPENGGTDEIKGRGDDRKGERKKGKEKESEKEDVPAPPNSILVFVVLLFSGAILLILFWQILRLPRFSFNSQASSNDE